MSFFLYFPRVLLPPRQIVIQNDRGAHRVQNFLPLCAKGAALVQQVGSGAGGLALVPHAHGQAAPDFDRFCQLAALGGALALGTIHVQRQADDDELGTDLRRKTRLASI